MAITLVASSAVQNGSGSSFGVSFTSTTAGTCLIVCLANQKGNGYTAPTGWVQLDSIVGPQFAPPGGPQTIYQVWAYPNNPGGITSQTFTVFLSSSVHRGHSSEWSGVATSSVLDVKGEASASAGTTLAPTTVGNVTNAGELAISGWYQISSLAPTFTTPAGFADLVSSNLGLDVVYKINPTAGVPLGPTLTSDQATQTAAGAIVLILAGPPAITTPTSVVVPRQKPTKPVPPRLWSPARPAPTAPATGLRVPRQRPVRPVGPRLWTPAAVPPAVVVPPASQAGIGMAVISSITPIPTPWYTNSIGPTYFVRLKESGSGRPYDLTGATFGGKLGTVTLTGAFTLVDAANGSFTYSVVAADAPPTSGRYQLQFKVVGTRGTYLTDFYPIDVKVAAL
jgi:hypothetical protein